jgi:CrcB protein
VINVTGSFILGFAATYLAARSQWRPFLTIGFIGAYTTFSTFEYESARLESSWQALANLIGSVVAGYSAVWLGMKLAQWLAAHGLVRG